MVKEVAELYAKRWEYPFKYWHADWEFYEDLEEVFTKYGIPREEMNIKDWMEIMDASSVWSSRPCGWKITFFNAGLRQIFDTDWIHNDNNWYDPYTETTEQLDLFFRPNEVDLDWGYPLTYNTNLRGSAGFTLYPGLEFAFQHQAYRRSFWPESVIQDTTIKNTEIKGYGVDYGVSSTTYFWNHFEFSSSFSGNFGKVPLSYGESRTEVWIGNGFSLSATYYFTNRFSFGVSGGVYASFKRISPLPFEYSFSPDAHVHLNYRIF